MDNNTFTVSINPWYFCNFGCNFCYLTPEQLADKRLLDLGVLDARLTSLAAVFNVTEVDLYGGEIGLLPASYIHELKAVLQKHNIQTTNLITNLSMLNDITQDPDFCVGVSYDFGCREKHDQVFANMLMFSSPFSILMLASPCLIQQDVDEMIHSLNLLKNLQYVDIKPYSSNQANQLGVTYTQHEEFVKKWITSSVPKKFVLTNEYLIKTSLFKRRNSFSDDHIYITPTGKFAVLEFDLNDNEFFLELDTVEDYIAWSIKEKERTANNKFCSACPHYGNCLSEHLKTVRNLDNGCNGFKHLLDWYDDTIIGPDKWKARQAFYHTITPEHSDNMDNFNIVIDADVVTNAIQYFRDNTMGFVYPAKSYVVAICYARWLSELYGYDTYELMNDPTLLFGNDPYYVPYAQDKDTYDRILSEVSWTFDETTGVIPDVKMYFNDEMLIWGSQ